MEAPLPAPHRDRKRRGLDCLPNAPGAPLGVESSGAALPSPCQLSRSRPVTSRWPKFQARRVHRTASTAPVFSRDLHPSASTVYSFADRSFSYTTTKCQTVNVNLAAPSVTIPNSPQPPTGSATSSRPVSPRPHTIFHPRGALDILATTPT